MKVVIVELYGNLIALKKPHTLPCVGVNVYSYAWIDFKIKILTESNLEEAFEIQQWCTNYLGDRWATTPPTGSNSAWYFINEADATLFRLRWL